MSDADVDTIIRDLVDIGIKQTREAEMIKVRSKAVDAAEDRILNFSIHRPETSDSDRTTSRPHPATIPVRSFGKNCVKDRWTTGKSRSR